jgi:hypothetical protein
VGVFAVGGEPGAIGGEPALLVAVEQPGDAAVGLVVGADRRQAAARVVAPAVGVAAPAIDDAVEQFRRAVSDPDNDRAAELGRALYALTLAKVAPAELGRALYALTLAKVAPALGGATRGLIAPDGALNVVPFSALVDDRGEFLIKRYTFTYLTSGRDLLRLGIRTRPQGSGAIFADPRFDAAAPAPASAVVATTRGRRAADLGLQHWKPLPGTAQEADAVEQHVRGMVDYRAERATETALKAVHGPRILHLATQDRVRARADLAGRQARRVVQPGPHARARRQQGRGQARLPAVRQALPGRPVGQGRRGRRRQAVAITGRAPGIPGLP